MSLSTSMTLSVLAPIVILVIPVLVGTLSGDQQRRRDARRVLAELVRLFRGRP